MQDGAKRAARAMRAGSWRGLALQLAVVLVLLILHDLLRGPHARLHILIVPALAVPIGYYASVLGTRGAILGALFCSLVIVDHLNDLHPIVLAVEVVEIVTIIGFGAALAAIANRERVDDERLAQESAARQSELTGTPAYWDKVSLTRMGRYVTRIESEFIAASLAGFK